MSDTDVTEDSPSTEVETGLADEDSLPVTDVEEVTIWAPEPGPDSDDIVSLSVEEWIQSVDFTSTEDVPIPDRLVDQVMDKKQALLLSKKQLSNADTCS